MSTREYQLRNDLLLPKVMDFMKNQRVDNIHIFLPIDRNKEPNTFPILGELFPDKRIMISSTDFKEKDMRFYWYDPDIEIIPNHLGIPEPKDGEPAEIRNVQLLFIPALAFDRKGNRIGYGGGYYDRILEKVSSETIKVGLNVSNPFDEFKFVEPHDMQMDYCITPFETLEFS